MMGLHSSSVFKDVRCCRRQHLYWGFTILSDFQQTYGLGLQKHWTLMTASTGFYNTFVAGLDAEKYFAVNLELIGCKIYTTDI